MDLARAQVTTERRCRSSREARAIMCGLRLDRPARVHTHGVCFIGRGGALVLVHQQRTPLD